jgi:hypothetical protein
LHGVICIDLGQNETRARKKFPGSGGAEALFGHAVRNDIRRGTRCVRSLENLEQRIVNTV